ncbi:MAG: YqeG family HAD IIIA-type phosphatase [Bacillota bacterium]|nr:YqeG family HAD IIIA-type phosphatase [Candidatus Fermentithermobacillaceae bacterium]
MADVLELKGSGPMRLFTPNLRLKTIYDLPLSWLKERHVRAILTDLDNTLVPWRDYRVADELAGWFRDLHDNGFRTVILTNARPSPTIQKMSEELETQLVVGARKPVQRFFRRALERVNASPAEACVIGDQVFTDVLGGNLIGCYTVLVERIGHREFFGTRLMRVLERRVLRSVNRFRVEPEPGHGGSEGSE